MKYLALFIILISGTVWGRREPRPYKILIVADENSTQSAEAYRNYILEQRPFNRLTPADLVVEIQTVPAAEMSCSNPGVTNDRLIACDKSYLRGLRRGARASIAVAFTSTATGGSGGEIPIATSDFSKYPISTMFHEMLHAYGFADEYQYKTDQEKEAFCSPPKRLPNMAYFNDEPPYESDAAARSKHSGQIPWFGNIGQDVLITHGTDLGTQSLPHTEEGTQTAGLFAGGPCSLWMKSWRPYQGSIMREYKDDTIYPLYEKIILGRIADAIGRRPVIREPTAENEIVVTPQPEPDCPPEGSESLITARDFASDGLRMMGGIDDEVIKLQLRYIQELAYPDPISPTVPLTITPPGPLRLNLPPLRSPELFPITPPVIQLDAPPVVTPETTPVVTPEVSPVPVSDPAPFPVP
ncbi:MAG: hypothetical protein V4598_00065 [Bdellovibrionota bacterium]